MKTIKVDKVILYHMDRVDPDGNLYRFYVYKGMASEIEYFCTEEAGNMTIPIGEGKYVKIVPKEIKKIPVRGYRKLAGIWNCETCNGKGWYRLFNYFKYKPDICYVKNSENIEKRRVEAHKAKMAAKRAEICERYDKKIRQAEAEKKIMLCVFDYGLSTDNVIYYSHTNTLSFNWNGYGEKITQEEFDDFVNKVDRSQLPEGIKFELK